METKLVEDEERLKLIICAWYFKNRIWRLLYISHKKSSGKLEFPYNRSIKTFGGYSKNYRTWNWCVKLNWGASDGKLQWKLNWDNWNRERSQTPTRISSRQKDVGIHRLFKCAVHNVWLAFSCDYIYLAEMVAYHLLILHSSIHNSHATF